MPSPLPAIGVFFGGKSPEHEVSIITGQLAISELRKIGYPVVPVFVSKTGQWFTGERFGTLKNFTDAGTDPTAGAKPCGIEGFGAEKIVLKTSGVFGKTVSIDLAFPAFHGQNGEDGTMQGVFELCGVPFVGCEVAASAVAMDKGLTKAIYESAKIPTTPFFVFTRAEFENDRSAIETRAKALRWPVFVKAARLGSSIGITKVSDPAAFFDACEVALHFDERVVVEEGVQNLIDLTCAVLGNADPIASLVQESAFDGDHFSYADKYLDDGGAQFGSAKSKLIIPARLSVAQTEQVQKMAIEVFKILGCAGTARVDFLMNRETGEIFANEVNALPGTLYHHLWRESGVTIGELLTRLIEYAKERHEAKNSVSTVFSSALLGLANSIKLQAPKG